MDHDHNSHTQQLYIRSARGTAYGHLPSIELKSHPCRSTTAALARVLCNTVSLPSLLVIVDVFFSFVSNIWT